MARRDPFADLFNEYAALSGDFLAQRKRLREARMKWIDEHERPTSYSIHTIDNDGTLRSFDTPFQIGKQTYDGEWNEAMKEGRRHEDAASEDELLEGLEAIVNDSETTEKKITVVVSRDEQHAFWTGGDAEKSPYPPVEEGESYAHYYARVSDSLQRQAGAAATGRPVPSNDHLRESPSTDSPGERRPDASGECSGRSIGTVLDRDADALHPGDQPAAAEPGVSASPADSSADPAAGDTSARGR